MIVCPEPKRNVVVWAAMVVVCQLFALPATAIDTHELFEEKCGRCHQHAGALAREKTKLVDGVLFGRRTGKEVRSFLPSHPGKLTAAETDALITMFTGQNEADGKFDSRCSICHGRARELAQSKLINDGNTLRGRYSGRDMVEFLAGHGRIQSGEVDFFVTVLKRLAKTLDLR